VSSACPPQAHEPASSAVATVEVGVDNNRFVIALIKLIAKVQPANTSVRCKSLKLSAQVIDRASSIELRQVGAGIVVCFDIPIGHV
jgi:hypothetical protein